MGHEKDKTPHTLVYMSHTRTHRRWTGIASHIKVTYFYMLLWLGKKGNRCGAEKSVQIRIHKDLCVTRCTDEISFAKLYDIKTIRKPWLLVPYVRFQLGNKHISASLSVNHLCIIMGKQTGKLGCCDD